MRIPDELLDCVVFLAASDDGHEQAHFGGTGFFVNIRSERLPDKAWRFLVTARHCVEAMEGHANRYVRANHETGQAAFIEISDATWLFPDDDTVDIAVAPWPTWEQFPLDAKSIPAAAFALPETIEEKSIGIGDELFVIGLFTKQWGRTRNVPIVRTGTIAAMPGEPLKDPYRHHDYDAYLAEVRSIGGLSGSPVFVDIAPGRIIEGNLNISERTFCLLGLIRGHFPKGAYELGDFVEEEGETLNTGIAVVTPIDGVMSVLQRDDLVKEREAMENEELKKTSRT